MLKLLIIAIIVYLINVPFGYWRANVRKFFLQWFLAIHIPVIIIIALRLISHLGFAWYTYIFLVSAFFLGQQTGGLILKVLRKRNKNINSCLVMNLVRYRHAQE